MREIGIDISHHRSKSVDEFAQRDFDHVLSVCDNGKESCPVYPGHANRLHHGFDGSVARLRSGAAGCVPTRSRRDQGLSPRGFPTNYNASVQFEEKRANRELASSALNVVDRERETR
jgi:hypothetical protein